MLRHFDFPSEVLLSCLPPGSVESNAPLRGHSQSYPKGVPVPANAEVSAQSRMGTPPSMPLAFRYRDSLF